MSGEVKVISDTCCSQEGLLFTTLDDIASTIISLLSATSLNHDTIVRAFYDLNTKFKIYQLRLIPSESK